jgi:hypothetical protein
MDVYLSPDASKALRAVCLLTALPKTEGLLIGHTRGYRYFVESILPAARGCFSSLGNYYQVNELYGGKIIGFFSFRPGRKNIKKILAPFAYGKIFLRLGKSPKGKLTAKSYVIEYRTGFFLAPVAIKIPERENHE